MTPVRHTPLKRPITIELLDQEGVAPAQLRNRLTWTQLGSHGGGSGSAALRPAGGPCRRRRDCGRVAGDVFGIEH
jgi:hypothetical protein